MCSLAIIGPSSWEQSMGFIWTISHWVYPEDPEMPEKHGCGAATHRRRTLLCTCAAPVLSGYLDWRARSLPIRLGFVIRMDLRRPVLIGHARPRILIEPRGVFQPVLIDVEDKALVHRIQLQCVPRDGE